MSFFHRWMLKKLGVVPTHDVSIRKDIKLRMPDGAELLTDLYFGDEAGGAPVIMIRSPYGKSAMLAAGTAYPLAARGYNVLMQSCRGTFGSSGKFDPHHDEQRDGLATLEWIKQQPWYRGTIATYGMSYLGYVQWAVAASAGPEVKAMAMQATLSDFALMTYDGDGFSLENAFTWTNMVTLMGKRFGLLKMVWSRITKRPPVRNDEWTTLPLGSMDAKGIGERVGFWQDWVEHGSAKDPWWSPMSFRKSIDQIERPITMVAGWYDIFLPWQMQDFGALLQAGVDARVTIGPWRHQDTGMGQTGIQDAIDWFNRHLRGDDAAPKRKAVRLYVIGADEWREFDGWPPRETAAETWYLQPDRKLAPRVAPDSPPDQYRYDPTNPTPAVGGPALENVPYSVDNTQLEARSDVITYTSAPLEGHRDIIGPVAADLYVASTAASADFFVRLCDVDANVVSRNICDGVRRVRIASPGTPQLVHIELWPTAYRMSQGHRVRVQISSGAFPRYARNLGGDEPLATAAQPHVATQSIHHSTAQPSAIVLPFV